ncbi:MAG: hypothetical protein ACREQT_09695 [Candidatus Binataceae bacterium]
MAGKFIKGALVEFMQAFIAPLPNVIVFQFNPETMTHTWTQAAPDTSASRQGEQSNPLAVKGGPGESFSFNLAMDAGDVIASGSPAVADIASQSGVYTRLAALEMLLYPVPSPAGGLLGTVSASVSVSVSAGGVSVSASAGAKGATVPKAQLPTVLFVWGRGRILPVRVTTLTISEKLYDATLNPTHAEAQLGLQVLTPAELNAVVGPLADVAKVAYAYSQNLRQGLASANLTNAADSILGMLPV